MPVYTSYQEELDLIGQLIKEFVPEDMTITVGTYGWRVYSMQSKMIEISEDLKTIRVYANLTPGWVDSIATGIESHYQRLYRNRFIVTIRTN